MHRRGRLRLRTLADVIVANLGARGQLGLLDATEVRVRRPAAGRAGRRRFVSGKARANTVKALVLTDPEGGCYFADGPARAPASRPEPSDAQLEAPKAVNEAQRQAIPPPTRPPEVRRHARR